MTDDGMEIDHRPQGTHVVASDLPSQETTEEEHTQDQDEPPIPRRRQFPKVSIVVQATHFVGNQVWFFPH